MNRVVRKNDGIETKKFLFLLKRNRRKKLHGERKKIKQERKKKSKKI